MLKRSSPEAAASNSATPPSRSSIDDREARRRYLRLVIAGAITAVVIVVAAMGAVVWQLRQNAIDDATTEIAKLNHVLAEQAEHSLQSVDLVLADIAGDLTEHGLPDAADFRRVATSPKIYQDIRQKLLGLSQIHDVGLISAQGDLLGVSGSFPMWGTINIADRDYFTMLRDHPELEHYLSAPSQSRGTEQRTFYIARRINQPDGHLAGIIAAAVEPRYFEEFYNEIYPAEGSVISLWRRDGQLLARYPPTNELTLKSIVASDSFQMIAEHGGNTGLWIRSGGLRDDTAVTLRSLRIYPLITSVARTRSSILANWQAQAMAVAVSAGVLAIAIAVAAWLIYRQFVAQALVAAARARASEETEIRRDLQRAVAKADTALRELERSEARFRDIAEVAADVMWETDKDHRFTTFMNDIGSTGKARRGPDAEAVGRTRWDFAGADLATDETWRQHKEELDAHRPFRDFRYIRIGIKGDTQHFCVSGKPVFDENGTFCGYRGTATNETRVVLAQQRAKRADALLHDAVNSISEGFVIYDAEDRLVLCNQAYRDIYPESVQWLVPGTSFESILRGAIANGQHPDAKGREEQWLADRLRKHRQLAEEIEQPLKDGRWVLVSERRMSNDGTAGLRIDITALKAVQASLRESQAQLNQAQRVANTGSAIRDFRTPHPVWSDEMYRIFGVTRETFTPTTEGFLNLVHPDDRARAEGSIASSRKGIKSPPMQYRIVRPDGIIRWIHREVEITFDADENPVGQTSTFTDITEQRAAEQRHAALEIQLQHSQKMEALGTLAGGIAHDLNNTLVPILALSKLALDVTAGDNPVRDDLATIFAASQRARDLVRQILAFSRKQELLKQKLNLREVIQEALQMMRAGLPATIRLVENLTTVPSILGDPGQLHQVVVNLVANAAQAIGGRPGTITVGLSPQVPTSAGAPAMIGLSIKDTGCGIDEVYLARIFEPFFTTRMVGEGTGLGLSVVHGIITGHGGTIDVRSKPGEGAEFSITLPVIEASTEPRPVDRTAA